MGRRRGRIGSVARIKGQAFLAQDLGVLGDVAHDLQAALDSEVAVDACEVLLDGLHAEPQAVRDGLVVVAGLEQGDDVTFSGRKGAVACHRGVGAVGQAVQQAAGDPLLAAHDASDRQSQLGEGLVLEVIPMNAGAKQTPHVHIVVVSADDQDLHLRVVVADLRDRGERVEGRHGHIDQEQVRLRLGQRCLDRGPVTGFGDDLVLGQSRQRLVDPRPHQSMVVGKHDPGQCHASSIGSGSRPCATLGRHGEARLGPCVAPIRS